MGGLTVSQINNKLSAEGTTAKTKQLILDFLNNSKSAADIAGIEPQNGPVVDEPTEGYGDQYMDYDIGTGTALNIIKKRNSIGNTNSQLKK